MIISLALCFTEAMKIALPGHFLRLLFEVILDSERVISWTIEVPFQG